MVLGFAPLCLAGLINTLEIPSFSPAVFRQSILPSKVEIPSFAPADFPPSTRQNDGTLAGRYDVRETMAILQNVNQPGYNSWFYLAWITTVDGAKYHVTTNIGIVGAGKQGYMIAGMLGAEDLSDFSSTGTTYAEPGSGSAEFLNLVAPNQNLSSPRGSDNYTDTFLSLSYGQVAVSLNAKPTGPNVYMGGSGYITLEPLGPSDFTIVPPGYSWYWGNPHMQISGNITVKGKSLQIDPAQSFAFLERQWGQMLLTNWYAFWLYLSNGIFIHAWINQPDIHGFNQDDVAVVTIWHPNGVHEVLQADATSRAWGVSRNARNGRLYFSKFQLDLALKNTSLRMTKYAHDALFRAAEGVTMDLSEAYTQGFGTWDGEDVSLFGHVEQVSTLE
ncbi:Hydroxyneurosporene synthase [Pyrenophora tritici-repentis]|uniref:CrtC multi-domain protein n=1 Tax=Pyrenophora tritici-repentis TaxID=45151 RepID=A0A2W1CX68_9PLEO|nr:CrtC multi-domain protein [Pyrenophora tritici-repentis]KAG9379938.1 Hydroxyneurosporene synthase [Pyrenophora tritici-repentis]KAI0568944.1 Hydroxyneurosporene synthase (CrtC) [Pyrenophora tritici-repentis]KAI1509617.1 Hydroxyneurosporene synthase [Pyrenophora tritici-repentis]KAI1676685.1 Hydroxyneurosporene synthase [Pyrenophora tritici-repentis]